MEWSASQRRIVRARKNVEQSVEVLEQIVRDEVAMGGYHGGGVSQVGAARALLGDPGREAPSRTRVLAILNRVPPPPVPPTSWSVLVALQGAGEPGHGWDEIEPALWARGWATTRSNEEAWHTSRAGRSTVGYVEISTTHVFTVQVGVVVAEGHEPGIGLASWSKRSFGQVASQTPMSNLASTIVRSLSTKLDLEPSWLEA